MTKIFPALLMALLPAPALAAPAAPMTSIVQVADLDLRSQAGQRLLDRRLSIAIAEVCGTASAADLAGQNDIRQCRVATRERVLNARDQRFALAPTGPIEVAAR